MSDTATLPAPALDLPLGIVANGEEDYHGGPGISRGHLWTIATKTPRHFRYGERKETQALTFGRAVHLAILQPEKFERSVMRGPEDRRGNKWAHAMEAAAAQGLELLTDGDYEAALRMRDAAHRHPIVRAIARDAVVETSGYWIDEATGELCRVRPDAYSPALAMLADLKSTSDASGREFSKSVAEYGYHFQEAFYTDGWAYAGGGPVDAFVFLCVEKSSPHVVAVHELEPRAVAEGRALYRRALDTYAECARAEREALAQGVPAADLHRCWPGYGDDVMPLDLPRWAYKLTDAPAEAAANSYAAKAAAPAPEPAAGPSLVLDPRSAEVLRTLAQGCVALDGRLYASPGGLLMGQGSYQKSLTLLRRHGLIERHPVPAGSGTSCRVMWAASAAGRAHASTMSLI